MGQRGRLRGKRAILRTDTRTWCVAHSAVLSVGTHASVAGSQTLGEEYTDIWLHSSRTRRQPNLRLRATLILLPTLPSYMLSRFGSSLSQTSLMGSTLRKIPTVLEVVSEVNLAVFYLRGTYYNIVRRLLGVKYVRIQYPRTTAACSKSAGRFLLFPKTPMRDRHHMPCLGYCSAFVSSIGLLATSARGPSQNQQGRGVSEQRRATTRYI